MIVTPDDFVLARAQGKTSSIPVGHYDDLIRGWFALLEEARLTRAERMEAELLFAAKIGYLGQSIA